MPLSSRSWKLIELVRAGPGPAWGSTRSWICPLPGPDGAGDLVAVTDLDAWYNIWCCRGFVTVGVAGHGASPMPGHGPGMAPVPAARAAALRPGRMRPVSSP